MAGNIGKRFIVVQCVALRETFGEDFIRKGVCHRWMRNFGFLFLFLGPFAGNQVLCSSDGKECKKKIKDIAENLLDFNKIVNAVTASCSCAPHLLGI